MKKLIVICATVIMFLAFSNVSSAAAVVVNFDDLDTNLNSGGMLYGAIPLNYQGLQWTPNDIVTGWNVNSGSTYKSVYKNTYEPISGNNFASNSGTSIATASGMLFDFQGAYFSTWAQNNAFASWSATSITVNGYNGSTLVGTKSMNLSSTGYEWLEAGFLNVTKVEILGGANKYWIMDDFTYAVPEPATMLLLGAGGMALLRRRK